jgi:hypothetical protein
MLFVAGAHHLAEGIVGKRSMISSHKEWPEETSFLCKEEQKCIDPESAFSRLVCK